MPAPVSLADHERPTKAPRVPVLPRLSGPCCPPLSLPTSPSSIRVTHLCGSPSRQAPPGCREGPIHPSEKRREYSGAISLLTFRHAIVQQHFPCKMRGHRSMQCPSIVQNDRIDHLSTLHAALSAVVRQILAPLVDHKSAATWTATRVVDACPISRHYLNRLLECHRSCRLHLADFPSFRWSSFSGGRQFGLGLFRASSS